MKAYPDQQPADPMIGFGEIALLYNDKRTASVTALTNCEAWVLSGDVFKHIIAAHSLQRRTLSLEYLDKVQLFKPLETYQRLKLIDGLKQATFQDKQFIFHKGDAGELFYIIEQGRVECGTEEEDGVFEVVRELGKGDHFGEIALINNVKRTLSVRVKGETQLLTLSKNAFTRILGSIKKFLKEDYRDVPVSSSGSPADSPRGATNKQGGLFDIKEDHHGEREAGAGENPGTNNIQ